jgi:hypothetical protein
VITNGTQCKHERAQDGCFVKETWDECWFQGQAVNLPDLKVTFDGSTSAGFWIYTDAPPYLFNTRHCLLAKSAPLCVATSRGLVVLNAAPDVQVLSTARVPSRYWYQPMIPEGAVGRSASWQGTLNRSKWRALRLRASLVLPSTSESYKCLLKADASATVQSYFQDWVA